MRCDATGLSGCVQGWNKEFPRCWIMALLAPHMVVGCNCNESFSCTTWGGNRYFGSLWTRQGQPRLLCNRYLIFEEKGGHWERLMIVNAFHTIQSMWEDPSLLHSFAQFTKDVIEGCHCEPLWSWHCPTFQTSDCHGSTPTCLHPAIHQDSSGVVSPHEMNLAFSVRATGRCTVGGKGPKVLSDNEVWMHPHCCPKKTSRLTRNLLSHCFLPFHSLLLSALVLKPCPTWMKIPSAAALKPRRLSPFDVWLLCAPGPAQLRGHCWKFCSLGRWVSMAFCVRSVNFWVPLVPVLSILFP